MASTQEIDIANASAMSPRAVLHNLPLPSELRLQIFEYAMTDPMTVSLSDEPSLVLGGTKKLNGHIQLVARFPPACIWTTRSIFRETVPVFFKKNVFRVSIRSLDDETTNYVLSEATIICIRFLRLPEHNMRWLIRTGALSTPDFRLVVFDLCVRSHYDTPQYRYPGTCASFRLRYKDHGTIDMVHQDCAFCRTHDWNLPGNTLRNELPNLSHPAIAGQDEIRRVYTEMWRQHSNHLQYLNRGVHALGLDPLGASLTDIDRVAGVIRSSFGTRDAIVPARIIPSFTSVAQFLSCRVDAVRMINTMYVLQEQWEAKKLSEITARRRDQVRNFTMAARAAAFHGQTIASEAQKLAMTLSMPILDSEAVLETLSRTKNSSNDFYNAGNMLHAREHIAEAQKTFNKLLMSVSKMQAELHEARDQFGPLAG